MSIAADLDAWTAALGTAVGVPATRDPDTIFPPCLFVDLPPVTAATLPAITLDVPVWLVGSGTGKPASDAVLALLPATLRHCHAKTANPAMLTVGGQDFHGYQITAQVRLLLADPAAPLAPAPHREFSLFLDLYSGSFLRVSSRTQLDDGAAHWVDFRLSTNPSNGGAVLPDADAVDAAGGVVWFDHNGAMGHVDHRGDLDAATMANWIRQGRLALVHIDSTTPDHPRLVVTDVFNPPTTK